MHTLPPKKLMMFYWSMQYGEHIEVLAPEELRSDIIKAAKAICRKYKGEDSL